MSKPKFVIGQLQRNRAAAERQTIIAFVEAHPGATTLDVVAHMHRSMAATSCQLRLLLAEGLLRAEYDLVPVKRAHYFSPNSGEMIEPKPLKGEVPKRNFVSAWKRDCPAPDPILAALFGFAG